MNGGNEMNKANKLNKTNEMNRMKKMSKTKKMISTGNAFNFYVRGCAIMLLAIAMLLAGCGGSGGGGGASNTTTAAQADTGVEAIAADTATTQSQTAATTTTDDKAGTDDVVTLTIIMENVDEGIFDTAVDKAITAATGVIIDRITATIDKIKILAASNDLPDVVQFFSSADVAKSTMDSGAIIPLDDLLDQYGANIKKTIPLALKWSKEIFSQGKGTYIIPTRTTKTDMNLPYRNGYQSGFMTRWDVYKAVGMPEMHNEDDFLDVLMQMVEHNPTTEDGRKIYALALWTDWGLWPYIRSYANNYGSNGIYNWYTDSFATEHEYLDGDSVFWNSFKFYNKAWNMGLMDPESFTMKSDQYGDKVSTGELIVAGASWWQPSPEYCGDEAICVVLPGPFPYLFELYAAENPVGLMSTHSLGISASCKYPEKAMQLLDYVNSGEGARLMYSGIKGEDWDVIDGKPQFIGTRLENFLNNNTVDPDYNRNRGIDTYYPLYIGSVQPEDGYPVNIGESLDYIIQSATPAEKDFAHYYGGENAVFPGQAYQAMVANGLIKTSTSAQIASMLLEPGDDEGTRISNQASQYFEANAAKLIMAATVEEFETNKLKTIEDIKAFGLEKVWNDTLERLEAAKKLAEIF